MIYRFNVFLAKPFFKHFSLISKTLAIENSFNTLALRSSWSFKFVCLLATLQPFQRNFQGFFQPNQRNQRNFFPFSTTKLKHVSFVSFIFPTKSFNFLLKFLAFIAVFKVIFIFIFNLFGCANVFYIFESKTRIVFYDLKRIDCEHD